jgi:NAD(P)H-quinone oxidoreductase subunit 6
MSWQIKDFLFLFVAVFTIGHAIVVVVNRNLVRSAFALLFTFLGVAGLYVFAGADFLAAIQVMVYVGGISILFLFAIMLTSQVTRVEEAGQLARLPIGIAICVAMGIILSILIYSPWQIVERPFGSTTVPIGNALLDTYLLPFEVVSILLIMSMVGAVAMARSERFTRVICPPVNPNHESFEQNQSSTEGGASE